MAREGCWGGGGGGSGVGGGGCWVRVCVLFLYTLCVMCKCPNAFTHLGNMGTGWVGSYSVFFLVFHSCVAADGPPIG